MEVIKKRNITSSSNYKPSKELKELLNLNPKIDIDINIVDLNANKKNYNTQYEKTILDDIIQKNLDSIIKNNEEEYLKFANKIKNRDIRTTESANNYISDNSTVNNNLYNKQVDNNVVNHVFEVNENIIDLNDLKNNASDFHSSNESNFNLDTFNNNQDFNSINNSNSAYSNEIYPNNVDIRVISQNNNYNLEDLNKFNASEPKTNSTLYEVRNVLNEDLNKKINSENLSNVGTRVISQNNNYNLQDLNKLSQRIEYKQQEPLQFNTSQSLKNKTYKQNEEIKTKYSAYNDKIGTEKYKSNFNTYNIDYSAKVYGQILSDSSTTSNIERQSSTKIKNRNISPTSNYKINSPIINQFEETKTSTKTIASSNHIINAIGANPKFKKELKTTYEKFSEKTLVSDKNTNSNIAYNRTVILKYKPTSIDTNLSKNYYAVVNYKVKVESERLGLGYNKPNNTFNKAFKAFSPLKENMKQGTKNVKSRVIKDANNYLLYNKGIDVKQAAYKFKYTYTEKIHSRFDKTSNFGEREEVNWRFYDDVVKEEYKAKIKEGASLFTRGANFTLNNSVTGGLLGYRAVSTIRKKATSRTVSTMRWAASQIINYTDKTPDLARMMRTHERTVETLKVTGSTIYLLKLFADPHVSKLYTPLLNEGYRKLSHMSYSIAKSLEDSGISIFKNATEKRKFREVEPFKPKRSMRKIKKGMKNLKKGKTYTYGKATSKKSYKAEKKLIKKKLKAEFGSDYKRKKLKVNEDFKKLKKQRRLFKKDTRKLKWKKKSKDTLKRTPKIVLFRTIRKTVGKIGLDSTNIAAQGSAQALSMGLRSYRTSYKITKTTLVKSYKLDRAVRRYGEKGLKYAKKEVKKVPSRLKKLNKIANKLTKIYKKEGLKSLVKEIGNATIKSVWAFIKVVAKAVIALVLRAVSVVLGGFLAIGTSFFILAFPVLMFCVIIMANPVSVAKEFGGDLVDGAKDFFLGDEDNEPQGNSGFVGLDREALETEENSENSDENEFVGKYGGQDLKEYFEYLRDKGGYDNSKVLISMATIKFGNDLTNKEDFKSYLDYLHAISHYRNNDLKTPTEIADAIINGVHADGVVSTMGSVDLSRIKDKNAKQAVKTAQGFVGLPYIWGGADPVYGMDCSGLTMLAWASAGVSLPHNAQEQCNVLSDRTSTDYDNIQPGDLIFYSYNGSNIDHVSIYAGDGLIIHAANESVGVVKASFSTTAVVCYAQMTPRKNAKE
ncbi:MAG: NlpC/P60 family protein [Tissierellia bacterium]|nr:NlpC/P60 family protein [Tissierellia bacterium]